MISASPIARAPARVAGAVVPSVGMARKPTGIPASAMTIAPSMPCMVLHQRRNGADDQGERRALAQFFPAARDDGCHLDRIFDSRGSPMMVSDLDVLDRVVPAGVDLVQGCASGRAPAR